MSFVNQNFLAAFWPPLDAAGRPARLPGARPWAGPWLGALLGLVAGLVQGGTEYAPSQVRPPAPLREFRGIWLASVKNLDWPSRPGLSTAQQQAELIALLDQAKQLHLNAVVFQVRPACDALYASSIEPWSEYLTGVMGRPPAPYYDPLAFAVQEAHRRGLELHAWFNPYRARHHLALSAISQDHISRTRPHLIKPYGKSQWLDPGERETQEYSLGVVVDVVRRYDIDGVHFDDYFYPYPEKDARGGLLPFPDGATWKRYQEGGGRLSREDWRRENVNLFMMRASQSIHAVKPWVRFGISPFGIWRPGYPAGIKGLDSYDVLYADSRRWLREGWVDYLAPQLYWGEEKRETSFSALAAWWAGENLRHRHVWPGLDLSRVGAARPAEEIARQIKQSRAQPGSDGNLLWGVHALLENRRGLREVLGREVYDQPALPPACPWLEPQPPATPEFAVTSLTPDGVKAKVIPAGSKAIWSWLVQTRSGTAWVQQIFPNAAGGLLLSVPGNPEVIAVTAIDRCGNASTAKVVERVTKPEERLPNAAQ
jgi:uncharacterized lipoprotein YddW (UPF0748 family)